MADEILDPRVAAIQETALAYFRKGDRIQYESSDLTYLWKMTGGPQRRTDRVAPECATQDHYMFSVCSSFVFNVLYNAFGYELCGSRLNHTCGEILRKYKDQTVFSFKRGGEMGVKKGIRLCLEALKPGDAFVIENIKHVSMHVMLCIEGRRIIHCAGGKINMETGEEKWENYGAIRVDTYDDFLLNLLGDYPFSEFCEWYVVRLVDAIDPEKYPTKPWALSRLKFPGLDIDRTSSLRRYQSVQAGDVITFTLRLRNNNTKKSKHQFTDLAISEKIPAHTSLVWTSLTADAAVEGDTIRWTQTIDPMQDRVLQYSVRVDDDVKPGDIIVSEGGFVDEIPSNSIRFDVGGKRLSAGDCAKLYTLSTDGALDHAVCEGDGLAQWIYRDVLGLRVKIPTAKCIVNGLYTKEKTPFSLPKGKETKRTILKDSETPTSSALAAKKMMVPQMLGGRSLAYVNTLERILEFRVENLFPGDVIVVMRGIGVGKPKAEQYVAIGGGKAVHTADGKSDVITLPYLDCLLAADYFTVLRPTIAGNLKKA